MKLIEKKCPSCGAGLKFDENDTNVTCEYCNKMYYLQKDEKKSERLDTAHLAEAYRFVNEFGQPMIAKSQSVVLVFGLIMFAVVAVIGFISFKTLGNNRNGLFNDSKYVTKISQIDDTSMETFNDTSSSRLQSYDGSCTMGDYEVVSKWESIGVYLLVSNDKKENIMYDVLKQTYRNTKTGEETDLFAAVKYDDLTLSSKNIVENDYFAWPEVPSYTFEGTRLNGAYGYESVEKLYNKLVRSQSGEYSVEASKGLYIED